MASKILLIAFVLVIVDKGTCLKCYKCSTNKDPNNACTDLSKGRESVTTDECHDDEVCTVYTLKNPATGGHRITRTCAGKNICDTLEHKETDYKVEDCHVCKTDLCDSGAIVGASILTLLLTSFLINFI